MSSLVTDHPQGLFWNADDADEFSKKNYANYILHMLLIIRIEYFHTFRNSKSAKIYFQIYLRHLRSNLTKGQILDSSFASAFASAFSITHRHPARSKLLRLSLRLRLSTIHPHHPHHPA